MNFLAAFFLALVMGLNAFASTLVLKNTKDIVSETYVEVGSANVARYEQLRIQIKNTHRNATKLQEWAEFSVEICAVDGEQESCEGGHKATGSFRYIMEVPPPTIRIKIRGNGTFQTYVWGQ